MRLAARDPSITVTGRVEDVRPHIEEAAVFVVPLRVGSGTRLKILEAMAMEKPVVSTTIGAEGLPLEDGVHLLLADAPDRFAAAVVELLLDPDSARALGARAAAAVRRGFAWSVAARRFSEICERAHARTGGS